MPELQEQMYCSQQIVVPPKFPYILKRYCKAAIKTQPYDLLRWSFEYFKALAEHRAPPVKLRLEYPIYSTEGGLTRGCLKVLANQLMSMKELPLPVVKAAWQGFCLDYQELKRIFCLCEVYSRSETVPFLHFIAVAAGLLTKCLTHTMILLCESLTKEPDGGSAAIPVREFLVMYKFLAAIDASKDVKYCDGYREGEEPPPESVAEEEPEAEPESEYNSDSDDYWEKSERTQKLSLIDARVGCSAKLSYRSTLPILGKLVRSASVEKAAQIEWENYQKDRKGKPHPDAEIDKKLRQMSSAIIASRADLTGKDKADEQEEPEPEKTEGVEILVEDEDGNQIPFEFYGEPPPPEDYTTTIAEEEENVEAETAVAEEQAPKEEVKIEPSEKEKVEEMLQQVDARRSKKIQDLEKTFDEIAAIVDRFKSAGYDLGMVAGRMMSTTSGEFIVAQIERDIMDYINEQIAILPDPDLKKKKAKPEEVAMIKELLDTWLRSNMDVIVPEIEEVEEEELPIPDIIQVYAVPGIGPPVDLDTVLEFEEYTLDACKVQADLVMPRNIRHFLCPPLEKYQEINYEKGGRGEEVPVPTAGTIGH